MLYETTRGANYKATAATTMPDPRLDIKYDWRLKLESMPHFPTPYSSCAKCCVCEAELLLFVLSSTLCGAGLSDVLT